MDIGRRMLVKVVAGGGLVSTAGCLDGDDTSNSDANSGSLTSQNNEPNCRMVTRTHSETVADRTETVKAGADWVFHGDREAGDVITIEARKIGGDARPALEVEDPYGNIIASNDPSEQIRRQIDVSQAGRYYIRFHNEALINSGMWNVMIEVETEYEEEVCS